MSFTPYPNEVYTIFSFFGLLMCVIPLLWHAKMWNVGACFYMFWTGTGCLVLFVNSIVWHGNALNPAPIWCDICVTFIVASFTGISASSLCINRRLYVLQSDPARSLAFTRSDKIRSIAIDLGICLLLPIIIMILHIVYQGHRFEIRENIGCCPHRGGIWAAIFLMSVPPALLGPISASYGIRTIISIIKRRNQFNELLVHRLNITSSLYFRLMFFAGIEALTTTPVAVAYIFFNLKRGQWIFWKDSHSDVNHVDQYPAIIWHEFADARAYEFAHWIQILSAFIFFSLFGFTQEAKSHYRLTVDFFLKLIGNRVGAIGDFQTGPGTTMLQSDLAKRQTFTNEIPHRSDSFSTISIPPDWGRRRREQFSSSGGVQDYVDGHLGSETRRDSPSNFLASTTNPRIPSGVEQGKVRTPGRGRSQNLSSFLNLDHSSTHVPLTISSQMDISIIEDGLLADRRSSDQLFLPSLSFLSLN